MKFEWNTKKNIVNIKKHGIDFSDVPKMFESYYQVYEDEFGDYEESRFIATGVLNEVMIIVIFSQDSDTVRVISARKAEKSEIRNFFQGF
jgi:uncharacterized DUF497 family protein